MKRFREIIVELSYNCNLSCEMCGFGNKINPYNEKKFMSFEFYKTIADTFANKSQTFRLNGRGESTIHPDFESILEFTHKSYPGLNINLFTNLMIEKHSLIKSLTENSVQLFVSIDSPVSEELSSIRKGANLKTIESNLLQIRSMTPRPFIVFTVQECNVNRIYDMALFARRMNCNMIYNTIRRDEGIECFIDIVTKEIDNIHDSLSKAKRLLANNNLSCLFPNQLSGIPLESSGANRTYGTKERCPALESELCILHDGSVTPCNMFNPYVFGNFKKETFEQIWKGDRRKEFINKHKQHYYCKNCANMGV